MFSTPKFLFTTCLALTLVSTTSFAGEPSTTPKNSWTAASPDYSYVGDAFTEKRTELAKNGEFLYMSNDTENGILFFCVREKFRAIVSLTPQNWKTFSTKSSNRIRTRDISMNIEGQKSTALGSFIHKPTLHVITTRSRKQAVKLYNAVLNNKSITFSMTGQKSVTIHTPIPNNMFADFGAACSIGRHK